MSKTSDPVCELRSKRQDGQCAWSLSAVSETEKQIKRVAFRRNRSETISIVRNQDITVSFKKFKQYLGQ
ncbi:hypothetical protein DPMN_139084 [Dreissena polymorpha]|uniref:Uncharacterized protein n=1 Tax=Dreissena polymorpha TaxID=45954 RepID=A0A9D4G7W4_DREPO|nr:hypothetical protein DPMN_139084 [Dreissena polymorpha]